MKRFALVLAGSILFASAIVAPIASPVLLAQFVQTGSVDFKQILTPPPAQDSDATKQEIDAILALQQSRTPQEEARAKSEATMTVWIFSGVLGSKFNPDDLPETTKFLIQVTKETSGITNAAKDFYSRKRPFLVDDRVKPCVPLEATASYPSGHSTRATVWALVLSEVFPDQRDALIARAQQIGNDRVLGGVHYPSDVEAGRTLAAAIVKQMLADADFQTQLQKVKAECAAHVTAN
jgi:acid phosphatase (class A)